MRPTLQVRLSQHLALTPQLQQSIRLLQLSTLELHQEVEQMLEHNPFLEAEEEGGIGTVAENSPRDDRAGSGRVEGDDSDARGDAEAPLTEVSAQFLKSCMHQTH